MEFRIHKTDLGAATFGSAKIASHKPTMPILGAVLLSAADGRLTATTTNLSMSLVAEVEAEVVDPGTVAVSAARLAAIVKNVPARTTVRLADKRVEIVSGRHRYALTAYKAADFPRVPRPEKVKFATVHAAPLLKSLSRSLLTACKDESRFHLSGVYVDTGDELPLFVSTDGHRLTAILAAEKKAWSHAKDIGMSMLIPRDAAVEMQRLLAGAKGAADIGRDESHAYLRRGPHLLCAKLSDANFPPYRQVIPQAWSRHCTVNREELRVAVRGALLMAESPIHGLKLEFASGLLTIRAESIEDGATEIGVEAEFSGHPLVLGVNGIYLREAAASMDSERLYLALGGDLDPMRIQPCDKDGKPDNGHLVVLMPMRI